MGSSDVSTIAWVLLGFVLLVMVFAQARLFSIDTTLKQILARMSATESAGDDRAKKESHPLDSYVGD